MAQGIRKTMAKKRCYHSGQDCELPQLKARKRRKRPELVAKRSLSVDSGESIPLPGVERYFGTRSEVAAHNSSTFFGEGNVFDHGILTEGYAEGLVEVFKLMAQDFPYSLSLRKTGALKFSKYLEECALSLAAENQVRQT
ncbi:hypothetical protein OIDMADRAFT_36397 [Oidiodendron maius Zn]|uniref:Uncharacterized protein n=1 Tax=Oidiodendron maius (strain Zn) TaxID=913774 RepID=A0A0C3GQC5_OIDMZ|nr:hypothetical protein OIDMADRAFT_36397 [Oidiodendron maius Zn]